MADKYQNKYRVASIRAPWWDYGCDAAYFVTICTRGHEHHFGNITDGKMELSPTGVVADVLWHEIKNHARNVELDVFVVMPNHVHGILVISGNESGIIGDGNDDTDIVATHGRDKACLVSTNPPSNPLSPNPSLPPSPAQQRFRNPGKNTLSSIVGSYKSAVTKHAHRLGYTFAWQPNFYEHIIRNEPSYRRITEYIINNPANWDKDKFFNLSEKS